MSRQLALDTIALKPVARLAHTEYSLEYHQSYVARVAGAAADDLARWRRFYDAWDFDFLWSSNDGLNGDWGRRGRATDMGQAAYAADGSDQHNPQTSPFAEPEEVWAFDAVAEYGLPEFTAQVAAYEAQAQSARVNFPNQLTTGGYYKTIISGAIQAFGWDMLLVAAAEPARMEKVLDSIFRFTLHHMRAWAETSVEVVIQHDDFVWTQGAFLHPEFYREVIIPRYAELWKPLHAKGKKVLFCSDGDFREFADDIVAAGADGLIFEPVNDFACMVERFGDRICLVGSAVDCRDLTLRDWATVRASMDRTLELARRCKGLIWAVGNHLPANIPDAMLDQYIAYLKAHAAR